MQSKGDRKYCTKRPFIEAEKNIYTINLRLKWELRVNSKCEDVWIEPMNEQINKTQTKQTKNLKEKICFFERNSENTLWLFDAHIYIYEIEQFRAFQ